jgi:Raf kinase inhibitor-like YbhB/YbcL family protein
MVMAVVGPSSLGWSGTTTDRLEVRAVPTATQWVLGTAIAIDATLTNTGSAPYLVDLFGDLQELYEGKRRGTFVASCWALAWTPSLSPPGVPRARYTLAREQFHRLSPGESVMRHLTLQLDGVPTGRYQVKVAYVPRTATAAFSLPDRWESEQGFTDPMWIGMAFSDPIIVDVVETPATGGSRTTEASMTWQLTSGAFRHGEAIPAVHTCEGKDVSPPLAWTEPPTGTKALALISDDPDAPMGTWVHWVLYNLPPSARALPEGFPTDAQRPDGARQGTTDFGRTGYGGPCPPSGTHRYFFKLYALDATLSLKPGATKQDLEAAMQGHVLATAELMGTYRRKGH